MKKIILSGILIVLIIVVGAYAARVRKVVEPGTASQPVLGETSSNVPVLGIISTPAVSGDEVLLIANYTNSKTSSELFYQNSCDFLVNGGFYTPEGKPLGLFKANDEILSPSRESALFDGFITINEMGTPRIERKLRSDLFISALQSGPMLVENGAALKLNIRNDSPERRVVAVVSGDNLVRFVMVQSSTLEALPEVIFNWAKEESIEIADALNLDGGSASVFRSKNAVFPEISPIGSAFCIKLEE